MLGILGRQPKTLHPEPSNLLGVHMPLVQAVLVLLLHLSSQQQQQRGLLFLACQQCVSCRYSTACAVHSIVLGNAVFVSAPGLLP